MNQNVVALAALRTYKLINKSVKQNLISKQSGFRMFFVYHYWVYRVLICKITCRLKC